MSKSRNILGQKAIKLVFDHRRALNKLYTKLLSSGIERQSNNRALIKPNLNETLIHDIASNCYSPQPRISSSTPTGLRSFGFSIRKKSRDYIGYIKLSKSGKIRRPMTPNTRILTYSQVDTVIRPLDRLIVRNSERQY